ncbi:hypothetical protein SUGI_0375100 [Cryptomeria japonica]|nr:hypothetical protein SUGI_0375100 [Cryptomeria japonica]
MKNWCMILATVSVIVLFIPLQTSKVGRPLEEQGEVILTVFQSMPRGPVTASCPSGCRNYRSSKGSTRCSCPNGSINAAGASMHGHIAHPNFQTVSFGVAQSSSIHQSSQIEMERARKRSKKGC